MSVDGVPAEAVPESVAFAVERFGWAEDGRLEVSGRWYGLRGHRFVRPALTIVDGEDRRRILAALEHKPWAAADGEIWVAAFPWKGKPAVLEGAELAVAPTLAVDLPAPAAAGEEAEPDPAGPRPARRPPPRKRAPRKRAAPKPKPAPRSAAEPEPEPEPPAPEPLAPDPEPPVPDPAVLRLEAELDQARGIIDRLHAALEDAEEDAERSRAERDEARADARQLERERERMEDQLVAVTQERDAARDAAPASARRPSASIGGARRSALVVWTQRFIALAVLIGMAAVVYAVVHSAS